MRGGTRRGGGQAASSRAERVNPEIHGAENGEKGAGAADQGQQVASVAWVGREAGQTLGTGRSRAVAGRRGRRPAGQGGDRWSHRTVPAPQG